jgi:hypothetical protein
MTGARIVGNRYRLLEPAGKGGMGTVWRAWDKLLAREVAIKEIVLPSDMTREKWAKVYARTMREAQAPARIRHPGVANVYDVSAPDEVPAWIAMEFVAGRSLQTVLSEDGPLPLARAAGIARQVLDALASSHAAGVLHRDLKPNNVMITPEGRAVLTDFGIARVAGGPQLTTAGEVYGTARYLSPERTLGQDDGSPASDLWALGATLFAAIRGEGPYDVYRETAAASFAIVAEEPPEIPEAGPLVGLIRALMDRDPAQRPNAERTALELDAAIALIEGRPTPHLASMFPHRERVTRRDGYPETRTVPPRSLTPGHLTKPATSHWKIRSPRRRLAILVAAATAVLAAVGVTAALLPGDASAGDTFRLTAVTNSDKHPELFVITRDGTLEHSWTYATSNWQAWTKLTNQAVAFVGVPAAVVDSSHRMEVFARATGGAIMRYYQSQAGYGAWDGPEQLLGASSVTSDPSVISRSDGTLEVFARLADGSIGYDAVPTPGPGASWSGWRSLGGSMASPPVAVVNRDGSPEVFALASDGSLVHNYYIGAWSGWQRLATGNVFTGTPTVAKNRDGRLEVFVRTRAGALDHIWQESPGSGPWSDLEPLGMGLCADPVVLMVAGGRLEAFVELASGSIGYALQQSASSTGWSGWKSLPGPVNSAPAAVYDYGRVDILARTAGGGITDFRSTTGTNWSDGLQLGGHF